MTIGFIQDLDLFSFIMQHLSTKGCDFQEVILFSTLASLASTVRHIIPVKILSIMQYAARSSCPFSDGLEE